MCVLFDLRAIVKDPPGRVSGNIDPTFADLGFKDIPGRRSLAVMQHEPPTFPSRADMYGQSATHRGPPKEVIKLLMGLPLATQGKKGKYYHGRPSASDDGRDPTRSAACRLGPVPAASVPFVAFLARRHPLWWPRHCVAMIVAAAHVVTFPVCVGLHSTELVLRGGSLNGPSVLSGLRVVDDKQFVHLQQPNPVLCKFLIGKAACFRPMAKTSVVEELRKLRDRA